MSSQEPGPQPDAHIEPGEPNPGGADAVHRASADGVESTDAVPADLDPDSNPAVEEALPDEMRQGEDTETRASSKDAEDEAQDEAEDREDADGIDPEDESPA